MNNFLDFLKKESESSQFESSFIKLFNNYSLAIRRLINSTYKNKGFHNFEMALRTIETMENQKFDVKNVTKTLRASEQRKFKIYDVCLEDPLAIFCMTKLEKNHNKSHF